MFLLPETAPEVHQNFVDGKHVVAQSESEFSTVWSDLGLEQTVVRDSKFKTGGIIGISRQENATLKWYLTVHERSSVVRNFTSMCGLGNLDEQVHRDLKPSVIQKDTEDIHKIISIIQDRLGNPFCIDQSSELQEPKPLLNIATGVIASGEITTSLLTAKEQGKAALLEFAEKRINAAEIPLTQPIKRLKLLTFSSTKVQGQSQSKAKLESLDSDRQLFARLLEISKGNNTNL